MALSYGEECVIFAIEGSKVEEEALARLDGNRNNPMALLPFVVTHKYEDEEGPISPFGIVHPESQVFAEIDVFDGIKIEPKFVLRIHLFERIVVSMLICA